MVKIESRVLRYSVYFQKILTVLVRKFCSHSEIWVLGHYAVNRSLRLEDLSVNLLPFSETLKIKKYDMTTSNLYFNQPENSYHFNTEHRVHTGKYESNSKTFQGLL